MFCGFLSFCFGDRVKWCFPYQIDLHASTELHISALQITSSTAVCTTQHNTTQHDELFLKESLQEPHFGCTPSFVGLEKYEANSMGEIVYDV